MAKLLHIQASPMGDRSFSNRLANAFFGSYRAANPGDEIMTLDLWRDDLPQFDFTAASGKYKIIRGLDHSAEEALAWKRVVRMIEELKSTDKTVVCTGMWNFSLPYRLKQYIDIIVQPGLTFGVDPDKGYFGLVLGKPLMLLLTSGGEYPQGSPMAQFDFQKPYLETIFRFMGYTDIRSVRVEGTLSPGAETSLAEAERASVEAARSF